MGDVIELLGLELSHHATFCEVDVTDHTADMVKCYFRYVSVEEHRKLNHARRTSAYKIKFMEEKTCEKLCAKTLTKQEKA